MLEDLSKSKSSGIVGHAEGGAPEEDAEQQQKNGMRN